jgi:hypothetical protein
MGGTPASFGTCPTRRPHRAACNTACTALPSTSAGPLQRVVSAASMRSRRVTPRRPRRAASWVAWVKAATSSAAWMETSPRDRARAAASTSVSAAAS